jgi:hypothetical protein
MPASSDGVAAVTPGDTDDLVWRRSADTAYVESPDRTVVLDLDHLDRAPYVFEATAAQIYGQVDGIRTETEIVAALAERYDAPIEALARDVRAFLDQLERLGLVLSVRGA